MTDLAEGLLPLLRDYGPIAAGRTDEGFSAPGTPRPHWRAFYDWMSKAGPGGFNAVSAELDRLRAESGVAFAAAPRAERAETDTLPVILAAEDWAALERGVLQRARLAEAALADIYGPQRMIAERLLPPGIVFGSQAFAAHCAGWATPPKNWLFVYEADVARTAEGRWVMLSDRLDTPLGDGWLLANRIATSQAFAETFVDLGVRRLASHYAEFQAFLDQMLGWEGRLALLTGGEKDPRFFSHAYFARYLNAALIEPADVTVRDGAAFVKTLAGLKKLDVLLRGVPDIALDALHRPQTAAPGAPALSIAARAGNLAIGNAIGSAVFAYRALAPYAPQLAESLLDEDLILGDARALWLGVEAARAQVLDELPFWRIERLTRGGVETAMPAATEANKDALASHLARFGERYAAVATPRLAHAPVWRKDALVPREWMMRVFACRTEAGWSVAPGGVASVVEPGHPPPALGFGKDVWVLMDETGAPSQGPSLLSNRLAGAHLRRTGRDLLSRIADDIFWLGRNAERAENTLRILSVVLRRYLSGNRVDADPEVLATLVESHAVPRPGADPIARVREAVRDLISAPNQPWGLGATLPALRSSAIRARAAVSEESWRHIDRLCSDLRWRDGLDLRRPADLARLIEDSIRLLAAFAGSAQENLTRNFAWRFLEMGRRIERGYEAARVAERLLGRAQAAEETYLRAWLTLSDSAAAYRSRYMMTPRAAAVLDLLFLDESNPRALAFQLVQLEDVLAQLPTETPYRRPEHRRALALLTELRLIDADQLTVADDAGRRMALVQLCKRCRNDLSEISDLIARAFFSHSDIAEALVSSARQKDR